MATVRIINGDEIELVSQFTTNPAPEPAENLLHSLATCVGTTMICHAAAQGVAVQELEIDINGDLDLRRCMDLAKGVENGFNQINISFRFKASESEEKTDIYDLEQDCCSGFGVCD